MLSDRRVWGSGAGLGFATLLAGIGIVADIAKQYDHRWGYALIVIGLFLIALCGALYLCLSSRDDDDGGNGMSGNRAKADRGSVAVGGDARTIINQHGGTIIVSSEPVPLPPLEPDRPVLQFGEPERAQTPMYLISPTGSQQIDLVDLWRISVTNTAERTKAIEVSVRLESFDPPLRYGKIKLHKTGDDVWPYDQEFAVRFDDPVILDVIAMSPQTRDFYLWWSDHPSYAFPLLDDEKQMLIDHLKRHSAMLTLKATAENADPVSESFVLNVDVDGRLMMEKSQGGKDAG